MLLLEGCKSSEVNSPLPDLHHLPLALALVVVLVRVLPWIILSGLRTILGKVGSRAGNEPSRARLGSARFGSVVQRAEPGSARQFHEPIEEARLASWLEPAREPHSPLHYRAVFVGKMQTTKARIRQTTMFFKS